MQGNIHSIESFGTVDGPGIRFVVFFQGCPMRCLYCHNPDTWNTNNNNMMSVDDILKQYDGVKEFLKHGGITATGGEPLMQLDFLIEFFKKARERGIHTCLDTSGCGFDSKDLRYEELLKYTNLVMLDIKHIDSELHKKLTGKSNESILDFAHYISDRNVDIWIRHVIVEGYTDDEKYLKELGYFISSIKTLKAIDVLPYHNMGEYKYEQLKIPYKLKGMPNMSKEKALWARKIIMDAVYEKRRNKN